MHWLEETPIVQFDAAVREKHIVGFAVIPFICNCADSIPFLRHWLLDTHFLAHSERWQIFGMLVKFCFDLNVALFFLHLRRKMAGWHVLLIQCWQSSAQFSAKEQLSW